MDMTGCVGRKGKIGGISHISGTDLVRAVRSREGKRKARKPALLSRGVDRGFKDADLKKFFHVIHNEKHSLFFAFHRYVGRRVSEIAKLRLDDLQLSGPEPMVRVLDCKSREPRPLNFRIAPALLSELREYLTRHAEAISRSGGYVFYAPGGKEGHVSQDSMRNAFRKYSKLAGLTDAYAEVSATGGQQSASGKRKLYRLSTHSFRHRLGTLTAERTGDVWLTQQVLGHRSIRSTEHYVKYAPKKVNKAIVDAAEQEEPKLPRSVPSITNSDYALFKEFLAFKKMLNDQRP